MRTSKIVNLVFKSGRFWRDEEKTWNFRGNEQKLETSTGSMKVILEKLNRRLWDFSSFEYERLAYVSIGSSAF